MINGYEQNYISLLYKLRECDFKDASKRLGLELLADEAVSVDFLGRKYIISNTGVRAADDEPSKATIRSILLFYATSKGSGEPAYTYSQLHAFSAGLIPSSSNAKMTTPLTLQYGQDYKGFSNALTSFGACYLGSYRKGEHVWTYGLLPKIPCQITYIEADDDLPCEIKVLLDNNADIFLEFEQMAFLIGSFSDALATY